MNSLLKFITCGSVDDGKSTLIGHMLYDAKLLFADQKRALELDSKVGSRGGAIDYSLLLDGLMAEREQGITIDVAYRYFTTEHRSFIVADTPGHEEYTRNMAVGASFAELAVILVDATQGVLVQTRRHTRICSLMGIEHFVFAVNKMDLINYDANRFEKIEREIKMMAAEYDYKSIKILPVSATEGDNVTVKSTKMPWYKGESLLTYLENIQVHDDSLEKGFTMPVQRVCRPDRTFRGFQGQIESGQIKVGDEIIALPSNEKAEVKGILDAGKEVTESSRGHAVTISLDREVDVSRGCVLVHNAKPKTGNLFTAKILWMDDTHLVAGKNYLLKLGTKMIPAVVMNIKYKIDVNTGEYIAANVLKKNEIAVCDIALQEEIVIDEFKKHKTLGELILIDRITNMTSACGVVETSKVDDSKDLKAAFVYGSYKANGDIFEEFYYNLDSMTINKVRPSGKTYTVGDEIPVNGESYSYPDDFDIVVLRDKVAVKVRDRMVVGIGSLDEYGYSDVPVINGRGFAVKIADEKDLKAFLSELNAQNGNISSEFFNKWITFETYRKIVFKDEIWN